MLCGLDTEDEGRGSDLIGATDGFRAEDDVVADCCTFGFGLGRADSLLTRTDAGTIAVSSGVCCANGLFTTVGAADLTYDGC